MKSRPVLLRVLRQRQLAIRPSASLFRATLAPLARPFIAQPARYLSTSPRLRHEYTGSGGSGGPGASGSAGEAGDKKGQSQAGSNSGPSGSGSGSSGTGGAGGAGTGGQPTAPPKNPLRVFFDVLKEEIKSSEDFQVNVKQLQGDVDKFADSKAMQASRKMYESAKISNIIKNSPRLRAAAKQLQDQGVSLQSAVGKAMNDSGVLDAIATASGVVNRLTQPIRETEMYKALEDGIGEMVDDIEMSGYEDKEARRARRKRRLERARKAGIGGKRVKANTEAGEALVLSDTQEAASSTSRVSSMLSSSPAYQRFMENYYESDAPFYSTLRSVGTRVGGWFDENEHAKVVRRIREMDPDFRVERWVTELREYIIPEIVDAYVGADKESLNEWMTEAAFSVAWAQVSQFTTLGLVSESQILEIRDVDLARATFRDDNTPVFLVTFGTDERTLFRHAKTREVMVGAENQADRVRYVVAFTRDPEALDNELTGGWKVMEMVRQGGSTR